MVLRALTVASLLASASSVAAAQDCEPLTKSDLSTLIQDSQRAIDEVNVQRHEEIVRGIESRISCLNFAPAPEQWAEFLVGVSVVRFAAGGQWQAPLTTALRIHPEADLRVGPSHPIASWPPPPPTDTETIPVPDGVRIYIDGELTTQVASLEGLHLVQRRDGSGWTSWLIPRDELPSDWMAIPELAVPSRPRARAIRKWGTVGAVSVLSLGGASLIASTQARRRLTDPTTPLGDLAGLQRQTNTTVGVGATLTTVGLLGGTLIWTVPW